MLDVLEAPPPENLLKSWPDIGDIPREAGLSKQDFERNYLDRHLPVILENKVAGWRALKEWTPEALANDYGDIQVHASLDIPDRSDSEFSYWGATAEWIPLRRFTELMATSDRPCYIRQIPSDRFPNFEDFFDLDDFLDMAERKPAVGLWFGSAGTDSGLHWDTESNFFTQIHGRKHVILCPPGDMKNLYPYRDQIRWTAFDAFAPNFDKFPKGRNARPIFATVRPGDTLFIPTGWWHHLFSLDVSISLSCFFQPSQSLYDYVRAAANGGNGNLASLISDFVWLGIFKRPHDHRVITDVPTGLFVYRNVMRAIRSRLKNVIGRPGGDR